MAVLHVHSKRPVYWLQFTGLLVYSLLVYSLPVGPAIFPQERSQSLGQQRYSELGLTQTHRTGKILPGSGV